MQDYIETTITVNPSSNTNWTLSESRPGYAPIMSDFYASYSAEILTRPESIRYMDESFTASGYARRIVGSESSTSMKIGMHILWMKK